MKGDIKGFKVIKQIGRFKPGKRLDHFGGLVSGVGGTPFTNKDYFKPIIARK